MQSRKGNNNLPPILRVDNCSEIEVAGDGYKQNGKYYGRCCDYENVDVTECAQVAVLEVVLMFLGGGAVSYTHLTLPTNREV